MSDAQRLKSQFLHLYHCVLEGEDIPQESDVHIAEAYFVRVVARLGNELAVIAFANACRLAVPGAFSAVTRIMNAQMVTLVRFHHFALTVKLLLLIYK